MVKINGLFQLLKKGYIGGIWKGNNWTKVKDYDIYPPLTGYNLYSHWTL